MEPADQAHVRDFLNTVSAKKWLEHARKSCPKLDLAKVSGIEMPHASLLKEAGWREAISFLEGCVQEVVFKDFSLSCPIDNTRA